VLLTRYKFTRSERTFADEVDRQMHADDDGWLFFGSDHLVGDATIGDAAYVSGDMNWPKYAVLLQAIELALN